MIDDKDRGLKAPAILIHHGGHASGDARSIGLAGVRAGMIADNLMIGAPVSLVVEFCIFLSACSTFEPRAASDAAGWITWREDMGQKYLPRLTMARSASELVRGSECLSANMVTNIGDREVATMRLLYDAPNVASMQRSLDRLNDALQAMQQLQMSFDNTLELVLGSLENAPATSKGSKISRRSTSLHSGWSERITDPGAFLGGIEDGKPDPILSKSASRFNSYVCARQLEKAWKGTLSPRCSGLAPLFPSDESAGHDDDTHDFVSAKRLSALWYGKTLHGKR